MREVQAATNPGQPVAHRCTAFVAVCRCVRSRLRASPSFEQDEGTAGLYRDPGTTLGGASTTQHSGPVKGAFKHDERRPS